MCSELDGQKMGFFSLGSVVSTCRVLNMALPERTRFGSGKLFLIYSTCACRMQDVPVSVFSSEKKECLGEVQANVVMKADPLYFLGLPCLLAVVVLVHTCTLYDTKQDIECIILYNTGVHK